MNCNRLAILSLGLTITASVPAAIINVVNQGNILTPGAGVGYTPDFFNDSINIVHGWNEVQNFTLASNVAVDATSAGTYGSVGSLTPGVITAGTTVSSHTLYFDPVGSGGAQASFAFDGTIIGVIVLDDATGIDHLFDSDFLIPGSVPVGNIPTAHFAARGIELDGTDSFNFAANHITVSLTAGSPGDQIRVLTTPEPTTALALGIPLLLLRRRRRG
jgi:hypothetical protein